MVERFGLPAARAVGGRISETGSVTFTVTSPGLAPVTFTGTAGPEVVTLVGAANGPDGVNRPWTLARDSRARENWRKPGPSRARARSRH